ncbi:MAG: glycine/betaine ABC transporter substrate-binding protein [Cupriavidus sp.]|uniref:ABC-type molybdate transport system substrate-binding protein n=2 Tax=Methylobacteriaceae TaxID=119045 RepID=A0AAJ1WY83_9HYPH|nr:sulfate-binding protein [Methylobacterium sp. GXF4]MBP31631.1 glycine/betaine ABC transporter substrate-binding protein [Methylobacterium sp.]MBU69280.1 glycine/betaine ABC transporter substrate-binding protein [Cupriavidus sp.]MDQ0545605.1 ABC-type molybdate transport system substrate-binding protein [Methylobacterium brachiatum]
MLSAGWRTLIAMACATSVQVMPGYASELSVDRLPPWQNGANNPAQDKGLEFTVKEADNLADFHGDVTNARLVLYVGGNYFFAMAPLVAAFEAKHTDLKGRIYYETIPPGLLARQMKAGGRITVGNMTWTAKPDAYFSGLMAVRRLIEAGELVGPPTIYATNQLAIMVPRGNPAGVKGLADLARPGLKLAMPNPEFEGVARQIKAALAKAGGDALVKAVYETKVADGTTLLTRMHHRQTPVWLMHGRAEAGMTWRSETIFQEQAGLPTGRVDIPADQNATGIYAGAVVKDAIHPAEAKLWLDFLMSDEAKAIFARYGFGEYRP